MTVRGSRLTVRLDTNIRYLKMNYANYVLTTLLVIFSGGCSVTPTSELPTPDAITPAERSPKHAGDDRSAVPRPPIHPETGPVANGPLNWHAVRFRMPRNDQGQPIWAMDLLLADQVVAPQLADHHLQLPQWRFHRRAGSDATGHQFSWLIFTDDDTAETIFGALGDHRLIKQALEKGKLTKVLTQKNAYPNSHTIAATSDPRWAPAMQQHWPAYMTGVSQLWLGLVQSYASASINTHDLDALLDHYQATNQQLNRLWREQGQHALLHHLSAAFGYQPLYFGNLIQF